MEHTSINPNKAAHIGHVRNAVLGDTMARTLRAAGHNVQVQNYIDNTGVQVADVVIGFLEMEKRTPVSVKMMAMEPRFDYFCWDLYARATQFFAEDKARAAALRGATLAERSKKGAAKRRRLRRWWRTRSWDSICGRWRGWELSTTCWRARARFCI